MKQDRCDLCGQLPCICDDHRDEQNEDEEEVIEARMRLGRKFKTSNG